MFTCGPMLMLLSCSSDTLHTMPKAATSPVATTRAALKGAQCKPYERDLKVSSSEVRSCIAGSSSTSISPYHGVVSLSYLSVPVDAEGIQVPQVQLPPLFYGSQDDADASTVAAKAFTSSSGKVSRTLHIASNQH